MLIPLFPLAIVVYPGQTVPLYIFEERYKAMVADCDSGPAGDFKPFGIALFDEGQVSKVGCRVVVTEITARHSDGSMHIATVGRQRFATLEVLTDKAYLQARVEILPDDLGTIDLALAQAVATAQSEVLRLTASQSSVVGELSLDSTRDQPTAFDIAANCGLDLKQKQAVLELASENERLQFLNAFFEAELPKLRNRVEQERRVKSNGHASP